MRRALIGVCLLVTIAACSSSPDEGVASLDTDAGESEATQSDADPTFEERILVFSQCMRDNGVDDFEDPTFDENGSLVLGGEFQASNADEATIEAAFEACRSHIEGLAFGPDAIDLTGIQDRLLEFSTCMRENGYDLPDPDFTGLLSGDRNGPFGDDPIDPEDPDFTTALEACQYIFEDFTIGG